VLLFVAEAVLMVVCSFVADNHLRVKEWETTALAAPAGARGGRPPDVAAATELNGSV